MNSYPISLIGNHTFISGSIVMTAFEPNVSPDIFKDRILQLLPSQATLGMNFNISVGILNQLTEIASNVFPVYALYLHEVEGTIVVGGDGYAPGQWYKNYSEKSPDDVFSVNDPDYKDYCDSIAERLYKAFTYSVLNSGLGKSNGEGEVEQV